MTSEEIDQLEAYLGNGEGLRMIIGPSYFHDSPYISLFDTHGEQINEGYSSNLNGLVTKLMSDNTFLTKSTK